jgi:hypothetical protein
MKPYGLRSKFRRNYTDCHPRRNKGELNWWEVELGDGKSKKSDRQQAKSLISRILNSLKLI